MANNKNLKIFGYVDCYNSLAKIGFSMLTNGRSIYCILDNEKFMGVFLTVFWPTVSLLLTLLLIAVNVSQMKTARKLKLAEKRDVSAEEMENAWEIWMRKNVLTCVVTFFWLLGFGIVAFFQGDFYTWITLALFLAAAVSRVLVTLGMTKMEFVEQFEYPSFPEDLIADFIEMKVQWHQQQEIELKDENWV